jgi:hypothetical protein
MRLISKEIDPGDGWSTHTDRGLRTNRLEHAVDNAPLPPVDHKTLQTSLSMGGFAKITKEFARNWRIFKTRESRRQRVQPRPIPSGQVDPDRPSSPTQTFAENGFKPRVQRPDSPPHCRSRSRFFSLRGSRDRVLLTLHPSAGTPRSTGNSHPADSTGPSPLDHRLFLRDVPLRPRSGFHRCHGPKQLVSSASLMLCEGYVWSPSR